VYGWPPTGNVDPTDGLVNRYGDTNIGWTGNAATALSAEGGSVLTTQFLTSHGNDHYAAFQCVIDHDIVNNHTYTVWIRAKESGSGLSLANNSVGVLLINKDGFANAPGAPDHYDQFWGSGVASLTATLDGFYANFKTGASNGGDGGWTPNSFVIYILNPQPGNATKLLTLDAVTIEPTIE
jgi:hypothetical protein